MRPLFARVPRTLVESPTYQALDDSARALYLWLWVGPESSWTGLFRASRSTLAEALGREPEVVGAGLAALIEAELVEHDGRVVYLPDVLGTFPPENPNMVTAAIRHGLELPACEPRRHWARALLALCREAWLEPHRRQLDSMRYKGRPPGSAGRKFAEELGDGEEREAPQIEDLAPALAPEAVEPVREQLELLPEVVAPEVSQATFAVSRWNEATGQAMRGQAITTLASARLRDGWAVNDLFLVARWAAGGPRAEFFRGLNDRKTIYLRPSTLWQASKFPNYLEEARRWQAGLSAEDSADDRRARAAAEFVRQRSPEAPTQPLESSGETDEW